jgi:hypothetical protein
MLILDCQCLRESMEESLAAAVVEREVGLCDGAFWI